jgi:hypothetical protein
MDYHSESQATPLKRAQMSTAFPSSMSMMRAALSVLLVVPLAAQSADRLEARNSGLPTAGPTIRSGGITPLNTVRTRISTSPDHGRRLLKSMSHT